MRERENGRNKSKRTKHRKQTRQKWGGETQDTQTEQKKKPRLVKEKGEWVGEEIEEEEEKRQKRREQMKRWRGRKEEQE